MRTKTVARLITELTAMIDSDERELVKFRERFAEDAAYAFQWGDDAMKAAARKVVCKNALVALTMDNPATPQEVLAHAQTEVHGRSLYPKMSTSACTNVMALYELAAYARLVERVKACVEAYGEQQ